MLAVQLAKPASIEGATNAWSFEDSQKGLRYSRLPIIRYRCRQYNYVKYFNPLCNPKQPNICSPLMWLRLVPQFRANVPDWNCSCAGTDSSDTNWLLLTDSSIRHSYKDSLNPELDSNRKGSLSTGQWDIVPCIWVHPSPCPCPLALNTAETIRYSSTAPVFYMCVIPVTFHLLGEVMLSSGPCILSILQSWMIA